jgi:hypothetical protein
LVEILLLAGGTPYANFKDLSHAWGREKGFHHLLAASVCERRGEVERKKRSDAGRTMTDAQRDAFKAKLKRSKLNKDEDSTGHDGLSSDDEDIEDNHDDNDDINDGNGDFKAVPVNEIVDPRSSRGAETNGMIHCMEVDSRAQV